MLELTEQQQLAVDRNLAPRLVDPRTSKEYVLVEAEAYDRVSRLVSDDVDVSMHEVGRLIDAAMAEEDASDPTLDYYQRTFGRGS